jgi:hypothetical protein
MRTLLNKDDGGRTRLGSANMQDGTALRQSTQQHQPQQQGPEPREEAVRSQRQ